MKRSLFEQDHDAFRESAREFVTRTIRPREEELAEQRFIDRDIWLEAGRNGFLGLEVPEEYGGSGADDYRFNAVLGEELARSSAAVASCFGIHIDIVAPYLVKLTTEEQKKRWLPGFCSGEILTAIAMTEPSGGSDLAALKTTAVADGDDFIVNGSKVWSSGAYSADYALCVVRTNWDVPKHDGISVLIMKIDQPGIRVDRIVGVAGDKEFCQEFFDDVRIPAETVVEKVKALIA